MVKNFEENRIIRFLIHYQKVVYKNYLVVELIRKGVKTNSVFKFR